ncbi:hypothetical protein BVRB_5g111470 [Beta vulgaris subsp. vulgaris]|nr:hypothetical protein BVRB_5g111470 [Beta vulgaris subsp. vulgaris]
MRDGDLCYIIIRARARGGFGVVHDYPGDDWDRKFYNDRQSLIQELNCTFYDKGKQLLITRLHPSQDARVLVDLLKSSAQLPPTIILQGMPPRWCFPSYQQSLESFLRSLAQIRMEELKVVRRRQMRIDFNLIPIKGMVIYSGVNSEIVSRVKEFIVVNYNVDVKIEICPWSRYSFFSLKQRRFEGNKLEEQLRDGDPCYIIIRARGGFGFVHDYPGDDWDRKFYNARQSLIQELNCTFYDKGKQLLITRLHPSQDARLLVDLLKSSAQLPPTVILKGLPPRWCFPS